MRAVIQRVLEAQVMINDDCISRIDKGMLVFLGIASDDVQEDADIMVNKIINLRIFQDQLGKMNLSLMDTGGEVLVVSQFTLLANLEKGRRPSFDDAAQQDRAETFYKKVTSGLQAKNIRVKEGRFKELMQIELINEGPVTIILDTKLFKKRD